MRRCQQRDMLSFHLWLHHLCIVEAKHAVSVIKEHVEMLEILNDNEGACYSVRAGFEYVQVRERRTRAETDADEPCSALNLQAKFIGQRRINGGDLGSGIDQKVVWAGVVDRD